MEKIKKVAMCGLVVFGVFLWLLPSAGEAVVTNVACGNGGTGIQAAITAAAPGDTISVTGTCNEHVNTTFKAGLTLDGNTTAVIHGPDSTKSTIAVRAEGTTIMRFSSISGGQDGIRFHGSGTATIDSNTIQNTGRDGILVGGGGSATINNNTVKNTGRYGVSVITHSYATITNNTVTNNPGDGIRVTESSAARIGFSNNEDTIASPNTIDSNGGDGVLVRGTSNGDVVGNDISSNTGNGVTVENVAHANISDNTINQNGNDGIEVSDGSGADLGNDTGTTVFDLPNTTTTKNANKGIECFVGGYVDGRLGSLNGDHGKTAISKGCFNSLIK